MGTQKHDNHHHILPVSTAIKIGTSLIILTVITVWVAQIDLGPWNFPIAMLVATVKALLVAMFFMGLLYDRKENGMIFGTSFLFLTIFMVLTSTDIFFRGNVAAKPLMAATPAKSKYKNPWISTPELVAHGKELFSVQCVACHGAEGKGNGPAASALNPPPRNFTSTEGWKNGRKPTMIFKTLKEGLPPSAMASFATLPADDRWALAQYVISLNPTKPAADTPADFAKIGMDSSGGGEKIAPTISIDLALDRMEVPELGTDTNAHLYHPRLERLGNHSNAKPTSAGAKIYEASCLECHGAHGEGGIKVKNLGVNPVAFVTTAKFTKSMPSLSSAEAFRNIVIRGLPGGLMPGNGQLSGAEMSELWDYTKGLAE